ncbi:MAG: hypothetical protein H7Y30_08030 [Pyrinomonadaceae bacterium]|nr:hypothetical protein [Pyrinomonadaceae bacterium]
MSLRAQLIANAFRQRFADLCQQRAVSISPAGFGPDSQFVAQVQRQLLAASPETSFPEPLFLPPSRSEGSPVWLQANGSCLESLRSLSLGQSLQVSPCVAPAGEDFPATLKACVRDAARSFQLLCERYECPVNLSLPVEAGTAEYLLERLMVQDRVWLERHESGGGRQDELELLLLRLNLVAVRAASTPDLRFPDALNYYYEKLPQDLQPAGDRGWLLASYLGLYARALAVHLKQAF